MANILALPEFEPIVSQFALGNFIRIELRPGIVKRARLLEVNLNFDDLSDFSASFGNLVTQLSEVDKHASLLAQAVQAGKTVATAASDWYEGTEKANRLETDIANGLQDATLKIKNASGQAIEIGKNGLVGRKLIDGTTDQYDGEQVALINNKLVFTSDNWQTSKSCFGKFEVDGEEHWGVLSDAVVSGFISGSTIKGGYLEIGGTGGKFVVHEDGSVQILGPDAKTPVYATQDSMEAISQSRQYYTELTYTNSTIFSEPGQSSVITCRVFAWDKDITETLLSDPTKYGLNFKWVRSSSSDDTTWNNAHLASTSNTLTITNTDIVNNAQFHCQCTFDETKLS
jgi:hypothetical protein